MIYWLYAHLLKRQITELPGHVCFMIDAKDMADAPENLYRVTSWCNEISAYVAKHNSFKTCRDPGTHLPYRDTGAW